MPALASITINDGKTTPAAHVFSPQTVVNGEAIWYNRAATVPAGYESLTTSVRGPGKSPTASHRVTGSLTAPTTATIDGSDQVVRTSKVDFAFSLSQLSTKQERKDLRVLLANYILSSTFGTILDDLEPAF